MARIPNDEIERLKREISITRLVEARGIKLVKHGADLMGLCVFHEDREPSLVVSPEKNLWHCLGACQTGGSVIDWVMRAEGVSFRHAVELLRERNPTLVASPGSPPERVAARSRVKKLDAPIERSASDAEVLESVTKFYHEALKQSPEALAYLERRGLRSAEMIERFRLGFANRTLGYRLPYKYTKDGADKRGALQRVGIMRESGHEHLNGSLTIPLTDEHGQVVGMYGRKIAEKVPPGTPLHLYLPGSHRGVFNVEALVASKEIILCEALIDALTFWCAGYRNVTTAYGVEGFTDELAEAFRRHGTERVFIAFDRDEAGERAAEKLAVRLIAEGIETYRVMFPKGMDANLYAEKLTPATDSLGLVLRQARWMGKGAAPAHTSAAVTPSSMPSPSSTETPSSIATLPREEEEERAAKGADAGEISPSRPLLAAFSSGSVAASPAPPSPAASTPSPAPTQSPPAASTSSHAPEVVGEDLVFRFGDRRWRVRLMNKAAAMGELRINLFVSRDRVGGGFFVDTVDLYAAKRRADYVRAAAVELEVDEKVVALDLGRILLELESRRDKEREAAEAPPPPSPTMTDLEREEALELLRDPRLLERIDEDLGLAGLVGERDNKLVAYLAATSRKLEEPLAVVIQSSSAAGKSCLMDAVLSLMPEEDRVQYSAMTGQSLFYMSGQDLKHKVLAIVEEEGAERASYALKLLQSEGELTIASTGKDPTTGRLVTHTYRVEGPVSLMLTTTAVEVDEELLNRCLVLTVDEGRAQTRAIHERQRRGRTIEGMIEREERLRIRRTHRNAQRLLRPLFVANPFAPELRFADHVTRTRRDHMKYLTLISAVALLHQHQRPVATVEHRGQLIEYIEATAEDVAIATKLASAVLGRSLDELPPQTRRLLGEISSMVAARVAAEGVERRLVRFSRREVREHCGWSQTQVKLHFERLEALEYLVPHRMRGPLVLYELAYAEGDERGRFDMSLGRAEDAQGEPTTRPMSGSEGAMSGVSGAMSGGDRAIIQAMSGGDRVPIRARNGLKKALNGTSTHGALEIALQAPKSVSGS